MIDFQRLRYQEGTEKVVSVRYDPCRRAAGTGQGPGAVGRGSPQHGKPRSDPPCLSAGRLTSRWWPAAIGSAGSSPRRTCSRGTSSGTRHTSAGWRVRTPGLRAGPAGAHRPPRATLTAFSPLFLPPAVSANEGDAYPLGALPVGTLICNLESHPGKGAQYIRAAGASARGHPPPVPSSPRAGVRRCVSSGWAQLCDSLPVLPLRVCPLGEVLREWHRCLGTCPPRFGTKSCCSGWLPPPPPLLAGTCGVLLRKVNGTAIVQLPSKRQMQVAEPRQP